MKLSPHCGSSKVTSAFYVTNIVKPILQLLECSYIALSHEFRWVFYNRRKVLRGESIESSAQHRVCICRQSTAASSVKWVQEVCFMGCKVFKEVASYVQFWSNRCL